MTDEMRARIALAARKSACQRGASALQERVPCSHGQPPHLLQPPSDTASTARQRIVATRFFMNISLARSACRRERKPWDPRLCVCLLQFVSACQSTDRDFPLSADISNHFKRQAPVPVEHFAGTGAPDNASEIGL